MVFEIRRGLFVYKLLRGSELLWPGCLEEVGFPSFSVNLRFYYFLPVFVWRPEP